MLLPSSVTRLLPSCTRDWRACAPSFSRPLPVTLSGHMPLVFLALLCCLLVGAQRKPRAIVCYVRSPAPGFWRTTPPPKYVSHNKLQLKTRQIEHKTACLSTYIFADITAYISSGTKCLCFTSTPSTILAGSIFWHSITTRRALRYRTSSRQQSSCCGGCLLRYPS